MKFVQVAAGVVASAGTWQDEAGIKVFLAKASIPGKESLLEYMGKGRDRGTAGAPRFKHTAASQVHVEDDVSAWNHDYWQYHTQQTNQGARQSHESEVRPAPWVECPRARASEAESPASSVECPKVGRLRAKVAPPALSAQLVLQHSLAATCVESFDDMLATADKTGTGRGPYKAVRRFEANARRLERPVAKFLTDFYLSHKTPPKVMALQAGGAQLLARSLAGCAGRMRDVAQTHGNDAPIFSCFSWAAHIAMYFVAQQVVPPSLKASRAFATGDFEHLPHPSVAAQIPKYRVALEDDFKVDNLGDLRAALKADVVGDSAFVEALQLAHLIGVPVHDSWPNDGLYNAPGQGADVSPKETSARKETAAFVECFVRALVACNDPVVRAAGATSVRRREPARLGVPLRCRSGRWRCSRRPDSCPSPRSR